MKKQIPPQKKNVNPGFVVMNDPAAGASASTGDLVLHEGAVATIVKKTLSGIPGISRLSGSSLLDNIAEIVRSKKIQDRSIEVFFTEDRTVSIEISLFLYFGFNLPETALRIQQDVSAEVEKLTGLKVEEVNVNFRGIDDEPQSVSSEEGRIPQP